jgi:hypothetical protein
MADMKRPLRMYQAEKLEQLLKQPAQSGVDDRQCKDKAWCAGFTGKKGQR